MVNVLIAISSRALFLIVVVERRGAGAVDRRLEVQCGHVVESEHANAQPPNFEDGRRQGCFQVGSSAHGHDASGAKKFDRLEKRCASTCGGAAIEDVVGGDGHFIEAGEYKRLNDLGRTSQVRGSDASKGHTHVLDTAIE